MEGGRLGLAKFLAINIFIWELTVRSSPKILLASNEIIRK